MIKIVEALGYPLDKGLMSHYYRTKALMTLLSSYKYLKTIHEKKTFKNYAKGLYQNGIILDGKKLNKKFLETETFSKFIPIDGPASQ
jgi:hypothetical protein